jgi:hypothetical protein
VKQHLACLRELEGMTAELVSATITDVGRKAAA